MLAEAGYKQSSWRLLMLVSYLPLSPFLKMGAILNEIK
jgi:hypothetical protein